MTATQHQSLNQPSTRGIKNANVITETGVLHNATVLWQDGVIAYIGPLADVPMQHADTEWTDAKGGWILPGFIDLHVHGGYGSDFMDASQEAYAVITSFHARNGTTGMLATSVTASREALQQVIDAAAAFRTSEPAFAELYGVHLEGPFISPKWPGAQNPNFIVPPHKEWLEAWSQQYPGLIRMVTLAPEQPGALDVIKWLTEHGIIAACGHTDASFQEVEDAVERGLSHAVHTFNAMTGLHHREPGTAGAVLTDSRICAEVIADGLHVHPACISLLTKVKTENNLILITDAMSAAGMGDGTYSLGSLSVTVRDGAARLDDGGALAGSTLTMMGAFRFMIQSVGLSVREASELASGNPAKRLGIYGQVGSVSIGKKADLLLVNSDLSLEQVWKRGTAIPMRETYEHNS